MLKASTERIAPASAVRVLGIGGSTRARSSSESALRAALAAAAGLGAEVDIAAGPDLLLPMYEFGITARSAAAQSLVGKLRWADALILASPGYHGSMSGMMKNALDYVEELRADDRVYCDGMAVGCIAVAEGWQAAVTTLQALRATVHALRGWPTPFGAALNNRHNDRPLFAPDGSCADNEVRGQLAMVGTQVVRFAEAHRVHS
jgi:FMN reductase